ncbi:hypothetical protein SCHPADRAFT_178608 [Schizopora paradoxa]|uniref:Pectin lyase-like protein n=1 Tax=Schizopora paradoxa TaxID=27342 RepID=A0A0H2RYR4_9AGAM|nr:hypothetical protein SCHPADRAFT_178608 [Schizopora paradoxa]
MKAFYLATLVALLATSFAKNDWTQACLNGACSYDVEEDPTSMGGSIEISGSPSAISDITSAAGWSIANCTDTTNSQTIQIVCTNESKGCGHIFQDGAQDTIVRLPENCGSGPFVRVVNHWVPDDQSVPTSLVTKRAASSNSMSQVHILEIDGNFDQTSGIHGNVTFELHAQGNLRPDAKHQKRQNGSGFTSTPFSVSNVDTLIFDDNMLCPSANGQTNFIFRGDLFLQNVTFQTNISIISRGTLSPPSISSLSFSAPTDAVISGFVQPSLSLQGTINVIDKQIMGMAFPSFTIADVVSVQPSFSIIANAVGTVQRFANCVPNMGFNYEINDLQFAYPSNNPVASVEITTPPSQFVAVALPSENANAQITMNSTFKRVRTIGRPFSVLQHHR